MAKAGLTEHLINLWEGFIHEALKLAPIRLASDIGSFIVRFNVPRHRPHIIEGARRNLRLLRPELDDAEIERTIQSFLDNVGRFMSEFSVLERLVSPERIETFGEEAMLETVRAGPTLALMLHTGNWEIFSPFLATRGIRGASFYEYPERAAQRRIVETIRRACGTELLSPDAKGLRQAMRRLSSGGAVSIFGDEARDGVGMAPLFGRPPHRRGNLAVAARLARHCDAAIVIGRCVRLPNCRFRLEFHCPYRLPPRGQTPDDLADIAYLNDLIEPLIRESLDQWYYLDDRIT